MKTFCFTVDDNIRFFRELSEHQHGSIFDHPYLAMYRRLHERYGLKVQLNLFYKADDFDLSQFPGNYRSQWQAYSSWLKMSFHSEWETPKPYEHSAYQEVFDACKTVHDQIERFAGSDTLAKTTTIHYCLTTDEGRKALSDLGYRGLLGLFGTKEQPHSSYSVPDELCPAIQQGNILSYDGVSIASIDIVLNNHTKEEILAKLQALHDREHINVMIHEQYFYPDYGRYQPDFEEKLDAAFACLTENGYHSRFLEECLN